MRFTVFYIPQVTEMKERKRIFPRLSSRIEEQQKESNKKRKDVSDCGSLMTRMTMGLKIRGRNSL